MKHSLYWLFNLRLFLLVKLQATHELLTFPLIVSFEITSHKHMRCFKR